MLGCPVVEPSENVSENTSEAQRKNLPVSSLLSTLMNYTTLCPTRRFVVSSSAPAITSTGKDWDAANLKAWNCAATGDEHKTFLSLQ